MTLNRRLLLQAFLAAQTGYLHASEIDRYPSKPIKITAPFAPGSSDLVARKISEIAARKLGKPFVIETRPGAQGTIATKILASASNDGYSLLLGTNSTHAASQYLFKNPGYDPIKDFTPIVQFTINPLLLIVRADLPIRNFEEFLQYGRAHPGKMSYGAGNTGSLVCSQMLLKQGGMEAVGVNYQGNSQAIQDFIAGRLDFMVTDPLIIKPFVHSGKLRVLGITSRQKLQHFDTILPIAEMGLPHFEYASWIGIFAPAGVAPEIADMLHREFAQALKEPEVASFLDSIGMIPVHKSRPEFAQFVRDQLKVWEKLTQDSGILPA